jgi:hypothetical protein
MLTGSGSEMVDHPCIQHRHSSTTALYTSVSSDYRTRVLRAALDKMIGTTPPGEATRTREVDR